MNTQSGLLVHREMEGQEQLNRFEKEPSKPKGDNS